MERNECCVDTEDGDVENIPQLMSLSILIPSMIIITTMIIMAVGGNLLVIISYLKDHKLHSAHNYYIFHLAITDCLLGLISMPFYAVYTALVWSWPFGKVFCKVYMTCDFTLCLQSVLLIIIVSWDRLILVKSGAHYYIRETLKVARVKVVISWIFSFLLYGPAIICYDLVTGVSVVENGDCDVEFFSDFAFTLVASLIEFILPFISITIINTLVFLEIRRRQRIRNVSTIKSGVQKESCVNHSNGDMERRNSSDMAGDKVHVLKIADVDVMERTSSGEVANGKISKDADVAVINIKGQQLDTTGLNNCRICKRKTHQRVLKAAKSLAILVIALAICWVPYTVATIVIAFNHSLVDENLYEILNWLLWFKASINPLLYAFNNEKFRENIVRLNPFVKCPLKLNTRL